MDGLQLVPCTFPNYTLHTLHNRIQMPIVEKILIIIGTWVMQHGDRAHYTR